MQRILIACSLGLAALSLGACERNRPMAANKAICFDFHAKSPSPAPAGSASAAGAPQTAAASDLGAVLDDCVRRWAYSLAPSADSAQDVANAALGACMGHLARWNEQSLNQANAPAQAPSITTGEPTNPLAEHSNYARSRALLYVVQARAGHCAPPPVKNGVPEGTSS
jgi:hypothetical protein